MGSVRWDGWQGDGEDVCHSFKGNPSAATRRGTHRGQRNIECWESLSEKARREWADGNRKEMIRAEKKSSALWLERQSEKREGGWERAWERIEHMKACCINGKVRSGPRINYPLSLGITNVIIWKRVLVRVCRGVEDLRNKTEDRDGAARV